MQVTAQGGFIPEEMVPALSEHLEQIDNEAQSETVALQKTKPAHKSIEELRKQNPAAFDFTKEWEKRDAVIEQIQGKTMTLSETLDGEGEPIRARGMWFVPVAPTIRGTKNMLRVFRNLEKDTDDDEYGEAFFDGYVKVAAQILHVEDEGKDGNLRLATEDEILDHFTIDELTDIISKYSGISRQVSEDGKPKNE